jgi:transcriptional regulator MftR-like protein
MSAAVINYDPGHGSMGARRARPAGAGGPRPLRRARVRTDHGGGPGAGSLKDLLVSTLASTPDSPAPIDAIAAALEAAGALLQERREYARQRQTVIAANAELQERELIKLASLSAALADTLRRRGVRDPAARLTAEAGIAVFKVGFERWINEPNQPDLPQLIRESLDELKALTAGK